MKNKKIGRIRARAFYFLLFCIVGLVLDSAEARAANLFQPYVAFPTGSSPSAVAVGDVNGDGKNDVVMTTSFLNDAANDAKIFVFLQNTARGLDAPVKYATRVSYSNRPDTIAIGDLNNDGRNDVVIGSSGYTNPGSGIEVFLQNNTGTLNAGTFYLTEDSHKIRVADLNNDGFLDVVGVGWSTGTVSVWLQNGSGTLNPPAIYNVLHGGREDLEVGDVNNDGLIDIIVMSGQAYAGQNIGVLTQKSDGTFNATVYYGVGANMLTNGLAVGDVNGDNLNDVVVTYGGNGPTAKIGVFLQNASGALDPVISYASLDCPGAIEIADIMGDGRKDIVVLHGGWNSVGIYRQNSTGMIQREDLYATPFASNNNSHGLAVGDVNGDGIKDILIADYNHGLVILYKSPVMNDVNNDGKSDLLLKNTSGGNIDVWFMKADGTKSGEATLLTDSNSAIIGAIDVNKDGFCDLIFKSNSTGIIKLWFMKADGTSSGSRTLLNDIDSTVVGTADINNDGIADLIFRNNSTGRINLWFMKADGSRISFKTLLTDLNSTLVGTGDINGDGIPDLLFRNNLTGKVDLWFMRADGSPESYKTLSTNPDALVVMTGDINGDGITDIIWRNADGLTRLWLMNSNGTHKTPKTLLPLSDWTIVGSGDFNGDGRIDLIWRNADGLTRLWLMNADGSHEKPVTLFNDPNLTILP